MANPEHVEIVKRGAKAVQNRRFENPKGRLDLRGADLGNANLGYADLSGANLSEYTNLSRADLSHANLGCANLNHAILRGADLQNAILGFANLNYANLSNAILSFADLREANLSHANLSNAILSHANLNDVNISDADLSDSELRSARLRGTKLLRTNLNGAKLGESHFCGTHLEDVDLSTARGLSDVNHQGPSHIDTQTLSRCGWNLPEVFLRGCGFAPWEVTHARMYDPAITPAQFAELQVKAFEQRMTGPLYLGGIFISYSHADSKFVDKIYKQLQDDGANAWLDRNDMVAGDMQKQVGRAIRLHDVVLLVLSESSVESDWVEHELEQARMKEKEEGRDVLCPVALDDAWKEKTDGDVLWRQLRKKNILDFSKWKTKAFEQPFAKLVKGLRVNYGKSAESS